jgi:hypothetical protein
MVLRRCVVTLLISLVFSACGSQSQPPASAGFAGLLPSPSVLRSSADSEAERLLDGAEWSSTFPALQTVANATKADFSPNPAGTGIGQYAFAIYDFNNPDFAGESTLLATWSVNPDAFWIGVANFGANKWEWVQGSPNTDAAFTTTSSDMVSPTGHEYIAILVTGATAATLDSLRLGGEFVTPNQPPVAWIQAGNFETGGMRRAWTYPGRSITLSFDGAHDPDGWIDHFNVDYESDGTYDKFYLGSQSTDATWTPSTAGVFSVTSRATDNQGARTTATTEVTVVGEADEDEVEPNDTFDACQDLPLPCEHFSGSVTGAGAEDWYRVVCTSDSLLCAELRMAELDQIDCSPTLTLYEGDGTTQLEQKYEWPCIAEQCTAGTYYLCVTDGDGGNHDYELNVKAVDPLVADLTADVASGTCPLTVELSATAALTDGSLLPFGGDVKWDLDDDGYFESGNNDYVIGGEPSILLTLWEDGPHTINVEVTDPAGAVTTDSILLTASGVAGDIEPNDTSAEASPWGPFTVVAADPDTYEAPRLLGGVAETGPLSVEDYYAFTVPDKGTLYLYFSHFQPQHGDTVEILDQDGVAVITVTVTDSCGARLQAYLPAGGTYYAHIVVNGADPNDPNEGGGYMLTGRFVLEGGST